MSINEIKSNYTDLSMMLDNLSDLNENLESLQKSNYELVIQLENEELSLDKELSDNVFRPDNKKRKKEAIDALLKLIKKADNCKSKTLDSKVSIKECMELLKYNIKIEENTNAFSLIEDIISKQDFKNILKVSKSFTLTYNMINGLSALTGALKKTTIRDSLKYILTYTLGITSLISAELRKSKFEEIKNKVDEEIDKLDKLLFSLSKIEDIKSEIFSHLARDLYERNQISTIDISSADILNVYDKNYRQIESWNFSIDVVIRMIEKTIKRKEVLDEEKVKEWIEETSFYQDNIEFLTKQNIYELFVYTYMQRDKKNSELLAKTLKLNFPLFDYPLDDNRSTSNNNY